MIGTRARVARVSPLARSDASDAPKSATRESERERASSVRACVMRGLTRALVVVASAVIFGRGGARRRAGAKTRGARDVETFRARAVALGIDLCVDATDRARGASLGVDASCDETILSVACDVALVDARRVFGKTPSTDDGFARASRPCVARACARKHPHGTLTTTTTVSWTRDRRVWRERCVARRRGSATSAGSARIGRRARSIPSTSTPRSARSCRRTRTRRRWYRAFFAYRRRCGCCARSTRRAIDGVAPPPTGSRRRRRGRRRRRRGRRRRRPPSSSRRRRRRHRYRHRYRRRARRRRGSVTPRAFVHLPRRDERRPDVLLRRHVRRVRRLLRRRRCVLSIAG